MNFWFVVKKWHKFMIIKLVLTYCLISRVWIFKLNFLFISFPPGSRHQIHCQVDVSFAYICNIICTKACSQSFLCHVHEKIEFAKNVMMNISTKRVKWLWCMLVVESASLKWNYFYQKFIDSSNDNLSIMQNSYDARFEFSKTKKSIIYLIFVM